MRVVAGPRGVCDKATCCAGEAEGRQRRGSVLKRDRRAWEQLCPGRTRRPTASVASLGSL